MDSQGSSLVFSSHVVYVQLVQLFYWNDAGIIILLPFIVILSLITLSFLSDPHSCRSFSTPSLIHGQLHNMYSDSFLRCSSSVVTDLFSSVVMQYGISMHDLISFMIMFIASISSSSLFVSWVWPDSQSAVNSCGADLYRIHMLY